MTAFQTVTDRSVRPKDRREDQPSGDAGDAVASPGLHAGSDLFTLAAHFCRTTRIGLIIDVGCTLNYAAKISFNGAGYLGIGSAAQIRAAKIQAPSAKFIEMRLDEPIHLDSGLLNHAIVVCDDTVMREHAPSTLMCSLVEIAATAPWVLVSVAIEINSSTYPTPLAEAEESLVMFKEFAALCGAKKAMIGFVNGCNGQGRPKAMMALLGRHSQPPFEYPKKSVLAIVSCYNDRDFIGKTISHLGEQDVAIWVVDNWSTDGTWEILQAAQARDPGRIVGVERFPQEGPVDAYQWQKILARKEAIARTEPYDWFIHYDSDELRVSPWDRVNLRDALSAVDALGYNAVDHTVLNFRPTRDGFDADEELSKYFTHCEFGRSESSFLQIKAWAKQACPVDLGALGGHFVSFSGIKVCPLKFLLKHYSLRSSAQARRKIHQDRLPRINAEESALGWHSHYRRADAQAGIELRWEKEYLFTYEPQAFAAHFIIERLSGINAKSVPYRISL